MTTVDDAAVERFLNGPAPYSSGNPVPDARPHYRTAEQELSDALEGTAPALSRTVAGLIGPARTAELAKAIVRATDLAVRRHAMDKLEDALVVVEQALEGIPAECVSPERDLDCPGCECCTEADCCVAAECIAMLCRCFTDQPPDRDEAEQQARIDRFMAGGNDV